MKSKGIPKYTKSCNPTSSPYPTAVISSAANQGMWPKTLILLVIQYPPIEAAILPETSRLQKKARPVFGVKTACFYAVDRVPPAMGKKPVFPPS